MKVTLVMAMTVNGKIARNHHELVDWTSREDKKLFAQISKEAGVVIMGKRTYDTIGKPLKERLNIILTRNPEKMESQKGVIEFTSEPLQKILGGLAKRGYAAAVVAGGAAVNAQFLEESLIDEMIISIEPRIFGEGVSLFEAFNGERTLSLLEVKKINEQSVMLHYKVIK